MGQVKLKQSNLPKGSCTYDPIRRALSCLLMNGPRRAVDISLVPLGRTICDKKIIDMVLSVTVAPPASLL